MVASILQVENMISLIAAIAVFATIMTLAMPVLQKDDLNSRMKSVAIEREKLRAQRRARLAEEKQKGSLKHQTGGRMQQIVEKLNLRKALVDESAGTKLTQAGYRKPSHMTIFLFAKVASPIIVLILAIIYVFFISATERPFMARVLISMGAGFVGLYLPNMMLKNKIGKRQQSITRAWPDSLDLLLICVESGMSLEASLKKVSTEIGLQSSALAEEFTLTVAELSYLQERRQAHENLATRTGLEIVKAVTMALIQAERYGTPLASALRSLSRESRDMRMAEAEKKAAALPPKLTVPMILFFLPVLFGVILGPAIINSMEAFK